MLIWSYTDGLVQHSGISIANTQKIRQSYTKLSIYTKRIINYNEKELLLKITIQTMT